MIHNPKLPPKNGYVEVETNGKRTYKNVQTGVLIENKAVDTSPSESEDTAAMLVDHEYRLTLLELGLTE